MTYWYEQPQARAHYKGILDLLALANQRISFLPDDLKAAVAPLQDQARGRINEAARSYTRGLGVGDILVINSPFARRHVVKAFNVEEKITVKITDVGVRYGNLCLNYDIIDADGKPTGDGHYIDLNGAPGYLHCRISAAPEVIPTLFIIDEEEEQLDAPVV